MQYEHRALSISLMRQHLLAVLTAGQHSKWNHSVLYFIMVSESTVIASLRH